jgi:hypothetical protein
MGVFRKSEVYKVTAGGERRRREKRSVWGVGGSLHVLMDDSEPVSHFRGRGL